MNLSSLRALKWPRRLPYHQMRSLLQDMGNFCLVVVFYLCSDSKSSLREAWETASVERATQRTSDRYDLLLRDAPNMKIGLDAFAAKKKPQWVPSKI